VPPGTQHRVIITYSLFHSVPRTFTPASSASRGAPTLTTSRALSASSDDTDDSAAADSPAPVLPAPPAGAPATAPPPLGTPPFAVHRQRAPAPPPPPPPTPATNVALRPGSVAAAGGGSPAPVPPPILPAPAAPLAAPRAATLSPSPLRAAGVMLAAMLPDARLPSDGCPVLSRPPLVPGSPTQPELQLQQEQQQEATPRAVPAPPARAGPQAMAPAELAAPAGRDGPQHRGVKNTQCMRQHTSGMGGKVTVIVAISCCSHALLSFLPSLNSVHRTPRRGPFSRTRQSHPFFPQTICPRTGPLLRLHALHLPPRPHPVPLAPRAPLALPFLSELCPRRLQPR